MKKIDDFKESLNILLPLFEKNSWYQIEEKIKRQLSKEKDNNFGDIKQNINKLIHLLGKSELDFFEMYKKGSKELVFSGLIIEEKNNSGFNYYGETINDIGISILSEMAITNNKIEDIIYYTDVNDNYFYPIIKLIIVSMNNLYDDRTYNDLIKEEKGIINYKINLVTSSKHLFQTVPINDFLYGLVIDGLYTEKQYDRYSNKIGSYKEMCEILDNLSHNTNNKDNSKIIKEQLISITNMFNNKIYYLSNYGIIDEQQINKIYNEFNKAFKNVLDFYKINFDDNDYKKTLQAVSKTKERLNK